MGVQEKKKLGSLVPLAVLGASALIAPLLKIKVPF